MGKSSLKEVPFQQVKGVWHMLDYIDNWRNNDGLEMRPAAPFVAGLKLLGASRGRSAVRFQWECQSTGTIYPMHLTSMVELFRLGHHIEKGGLAQGCWIYKKRGSNYTIWPVIPDAS
jgi:hypothetical protein